VKQLGYTKITTHTFDRANPCSDRNVWRFCHTQETSPRISSYVQPIRHSENETHGIARIGLDCAVFYVPSNTIRKRVYLKTVICKPRVGILVN